MSVFDAEQTYNAGLIIAEAKRRGLGYDAQVVCVCVGITESSLRNIGFGDATGPDSRGLFQQRDPWGPLWVRMSPPLATGLFLDRMVNVKDWQTQATTTPWVLAQTVQGSQFSDGSNYRGNIADAHTLVPAPVTVAPPTAPQLVDQIVDILGAQPAVVPEVAARLATILTVDPLSVTHSFAIAKNRRTHGMPAQQ